jgi:hypothetical protein
VVLDKKYIKSIKIHFFIFKGIIFNVNLLTLMFPFWDQRTSAPAKGFVNMKREIPLK